MTLAHEVVGNGPAVLLLHAGVMDRRMWDPQWATLTAAGYRVIRADLRGYGATPPAAGPHDDAADVLALLDRLGVTEVALVGASFGGEVAQLVAARRPEHVWALVLLDAAPAGDHDPSDELREFVAREESLLETGDIAAAVELNVDTWLGPGADAATRDRLRRAQREIFEIQLAAEDFPPIDADFTVTAIQAPLLTVSGRHDLPDFRRVATELAAAVPDGRHIELDTGHLPSLERPGEVSALLEEFLSLALRA